MKKIIPLPPLPSSSRQNILAVHTHLQNVCSENIFENSSRRYIPAAAQHQQKIYEHNNIKKKKFFKITFQPLKTFKKLKIFNFQMKFIFDRIEKIFSYPSPSSTSKNDYNPFPLMIYICASN